MGFLVVPLSLVCLYFLFAAIWAYSPLLAIVIILYAILCLLGVYFVATDETGGNNVK